MEERNAFRLLRDLAAIYLKWFKRFEITGAENIPLQGPVILVANHSAAYDPVCLQVACRARTIRFLEAREYYNRRPLNWIYSALRVIPVNRTGVDTACLRTAMRELAANGCIGIFPEGRINSGGQLGEARQGAALLALHCNAPIVPAYIQGNRESSGMIRDFLRFDRITLNFGPPIRLDDLAAERTDRHVRGLALGRIMNALSDLAERSNREDLGLRTAA